MNVAASESTPGRIDGQKARVGRLYGLSAFDHVYRPPNRKGLCSHASMHNTNHNVSAFIKPKVSVPYRDRRASTRSSYRRSNAAGGSVKRSTENWISVC